MTKELDYIADLERENRLVKSFLYCTTKSCNNCGKVNCENFQRQRIDCCGLWVSYKDYIAELEKENLVLHRMNRKRLNLQKERVQLKERLAETNLNGNIVLRELTKATEIIKELLSCCRNYPQENAEKMEQAEQFLKEIEK